MSIELPDHPVLGADIHLPLDRPFTTATALASGLTHQQLRDLVESGCLAHPMRGVFYATVLVDDLRLRLACVKLVVPSACVITDRTAAWLWGAETALAPNDHLRVPRVHVFCPPGHRLRNGLVASGERIFAPEDVVELDGVLVTSPLRTACDIGRLQSRDLAFAGMDALAGLGLFEVDELVAATARFRGYRGIIQFRTLAPLVDRRAQSPGESILRLRWLDAGLPRPELQIQVPAPFGGIYLLDMGLPGLRFAAEYDGAAFHTEEDQPHDNARRTWVRRELGWTLVVARNENVHGRSQDIDSLLHQGLRTARENN